MPLVNTFLLPVFLLIGTLGNGWLGIRLADAEQPTIAEVVPNSPAARAGLKLGDVILAVDGKSVRTAAALIEVVQTKDAGDRVELTVRRGDKKMSLKVRLGTRPVEGREPVRRAQPTKRPGKVAGGPGYLGVEIEESAGGQIVVTDIVDGAPAAKSGLRRGDRILQINSVKIGGMDDLDKAIAGMKVADMLRMQVARNGRERWLSITAGARPGAKPGGEVRPGKKKIVKTPVRKPTKRLVPKPVQKPKSVVRLPAQPLAAPETKFSTSLQKSMERAKKTKRPLMVVFGAEWCVNCKTLKKSFEHKSLQPHLARYELVWIDTDKQSALADKYNVESLPHTVFMAWNGKPRKTVIGYQPPEILKPILAAGLPKKTATKAGQGRNVAKKPRRARRPAKAGPTGPTKAGAGVMAAQVPPAGASAAELKRLREEVMRLRKEQAETKKVLQQVLRELKKQNEGR